MPQIGETRGPFPTWHISLGRVGGLTPVTHRRTANVSVRKRDHSENVIATKKILTNEPPNHTLPIGYASTYLEDDRHNRQLIMLSGVTYRRADAGANAKVTKCVW